MTKPRAYQVKALYYDSDFGFTTPIKQRVYERLEDGIIETPITSLFEARLFTPSKDCKPPRAKEFEPRLVKACFANPNNDTGESIRSVVIPYRPTDQVSFRAHIREINSFQGVQAVDYKGETHTSSVARYFR